MERMKALLHEVAKKNTDDYLNTFFLDPQNNVAIAGYRRMYGCGDLLVRIKAQEIDMGRNDRISGNFSYQDEKYYAEPGLPGKTNPDGSREVVDAELADKKMLEVFNQVNDSDETFTVLLNPKMICEFIEERTASASFQDKKINIQIFDGLNSLGMFAAPVTTLRTGEPVISLTGFGTAHIDEQQSNIPLNRLIDNKVYIVQGVREVEGVRFVKVIREYKRGLRLAIQTFRNGLLLPNQPRYSVIDDRGSNIGVADILDIPFIQFPNFRQGNAKGNFLRAPMLHIDLDTLYRALKPMESFRTVEMKFKDSITGIYFSTVNQPNDTMRIDAIVGPTSPYKSGKIYTL